jgi:hypothetical protein
MLEMQKEALRAKVNGIYGYNAISRVHITQTAPTGFSDGQVDFKYAPRTRSQPAPAPEDVAQAQASAAVVENDELRAALERLGQNVLTRQKTKGKGY